MNIEVIRDRGYEVHPVSVVATEKPVGHYKTFLYESWVYDSEAEASQKLHELKLVQIQEVEHKFASNLDKLQKIKK